MEEMINSDINELKIAATKLGGKGLEELKIAATKLGGKGLDTSLLPCECFVMQGLVWVHLLQTQFNGCWEMDWLRCSGVEALLSTTFSRV
ncbi:uncharacterized protein LOC111804404 isoform X2 [Cucurbita pepo subsp. pepo]|uniref:uncharacterized protein LOC111804404 isoform X2 n=1 Tax=Cucurbita pepo subsp. pepo TaxID=3664 RepID=UPI000C9D524D|nr:uncharacterized protein LOC111804404 isoform X2 [Cucurbita pepo subsp. pepo]